MAKVKKEKKPKFKVGDRAEVIKSESHHFKSGEIVKVVSLEGDNLYGCNSTTGPLYQLVIGDELKKILPKKGDKLKVINNDGYHLFEVGDIVEVVSCTAEYNLVAQKDRLQQYLMPQHYEVIDEEPEVTSDELEEDYSDVFGGDVTTSLSTTTKRIGIGDIVKISKHSEYYDIGEDDNPADTKGIVSHISDDDYEVEWSNGTWNTYSLDDLVVLKRYKDEDN